MKYLILVFFIVFALQGCSAPPIDTPVYYEGSAKIFESGQVKDFLNNEWVAEMSLMQSGQKTIVLADIRYKGNLTRYESFDGKTWGNRRVIYDEWFPRFAYAVLHDGVIYMTYCTWYGDKNIYLMKSLDEGYTWEIINGGKPILTRDDDPESIYHKLWNTAFFIDGNTWHLYVESSPSCNEQERVGIAYLTGTFANDMIDFNASKSSHGSFVKLGGGNPWVHKRGNKIYMLYGVIDSEVSRGEKWAVTAALIHDLTNNAIIDCDFKIGGVGIHVCDPHVVQRPNELMLIYSYDQHSCYAAFTYKTLDEFLDML